MNSKEVEEFSQRVNKIEKLSDLKNLLRIIQIEREKKLEDLFNKIITNTKTGKPSTESNLSESQWFIRQEEEIINEFTKKEQLINTRISEIDDKKNTGTKKVENKNLLEQLENERKRLELFKIKGEIRSREIKDELEIALMREELLSKSNTYENVNKVKIDYKFLLRQYSNSVFLISFFRLFSLFLTATIFLNLYSKSEIDLGIGIYIFIFLIVIYLLLEFYQLGNVRKTNNFLFSLTKNNEAKN